MADINVFDWMELTRPNQKGMTQKEKNALKAIRKRVFKLAKTSANAIVVARSRGSIGSNLYNAILNATQEEAENFKVNVSYEDYLKHAEKERKIREAMKSIELAARG